LVSRHSWVIMSLFSSSNRKLIFLPIMLFEKCFNQVNLAILRVSAYIVFVTDWTGRILIVVGLIENRILRRIMLRQWPNRFKTSTKPSRFATLRVLTLPAFGSSSKFGFCIWVGCPNLQISAWLKLTRTTKNDLKK
jgi:hypothetical protein